MSISQKNIACNLIYNNGDEGIYVGFKGKCDIQNIIYNVRFDENRWCSQPECSCRKFYNKGYKGRIDDYPCNESRLFADWIWNPGNEFKTGRPFKIQNTGVGKIAVMTTKFKNCSESERKIVGFFKIKNLMDNHHVISALRKQSLRLTKDEAQDLNFWNYHKNKNSPIPEWRQGGFRYLEDTQVAAILHDLKNVVKDKRAQSMIAELLRNDFPQFSKSRPILKSALNEHPVKKVWLKRKYGPGGESKEHKQLKEFVAKNPDRIGLNKTKVKETVEHLFISGDIVDILFESKIDNTNTVVEIELNNVEPGIHQAIKYRALRCSQLGLSLTNKNIKASVVAWKINESEKQLCRKYGINFYEITSV